MTRGGRWRFAVAAGAGLGLAALGGGPRVAAAQEPARPDTTAPAEDPAPPVPTVPGDTTGGEARPDTTEVPAAAAAPGRRRPRLAISIGVSTLGIGDLQVQPLLAERVDAEGEPTQEWAVRRSLGVEGGYQLRASALLNLGPAWGVRGGVGVGRATVTTGYGADAGEELVDEVRALPIETRADLDVLTVEAALRFRLPVGRAAVPYAELGLAAERWRAPSDLDDAVPGAEYLLETVNRVGARLAVGATIPLRPRLSARFEASVHLLQTPTPPVAAGGIVAASDSLRLTAAAPSAAPFADAAIEMVRATRLEIGVSYGLGAAPGAPRDRAESTGSTSAPPR